jgi:hypothetical protein
MTFYLRDDVHHMAVAFDGHQIATCGTQNHKHDPVIAREVTSMTCSARSWDRPTIPFQSQIFFGVFAAASRTGNRTDFHFALLATHVNFWRSAQGKGV